MRLVNLLIDEAAADEAGLAPARAWIDREGWGVMTEAAAAEPNQEPDPDAVARAKAERREREKEVLLRDIAASTTNDLAGFAFPGDTHGASDFVYVHRLV